jgi:hypothetical protein
MKEFKFVMNEYKNVCYVYVDVNKPPIDTMYLTQHLERNKPHEAGEIKSGWTPQCFQIKNILTVCAYNAECLVVSHSINFCYFIRLVV